MIFAAVIVPFLSNQIEDYVSQFVRDPEVHKLIGDRYIWSTEDYMNKLRSIPILMELVKNPFLLSLALRALPGVIKGAVDLANIKVTRLTLYDSFIDQWLEINKLRLKTIKLSAKSETALQELLEEGFTPIAIGYLKNLAGAIFREQDGNPVVQYTSRSDKGTWKVDFFGSKPDITLLRESSPLSRAGVQYRFIHRSLLEYCYSRHVYETSNSNFVSGVDQDLAEHPLSQRNLVNDPSVVQFLAEHVQGDSDFKQQLYCIIEADPETTQAAANAITILIQCASEKYLVVDDLIRILSSLRARLQDIHQQLNEHHCHVISAVSRLFDVMAEHKFENTELVLHLANEPISLMDSGREVFENLKDGLGNGNKRLWYPALCAADNFLLGEIAADTTWEIGTRQKAIDTLADLYIYDADWARDVSVKAAMLAIIEQLRQAPDPAIKVRATTLMSDLQ
ncbi:hypothetical protein BGZ58_010675 [Dissophora ornata]|nr:hypothetical protein BGZ58_010675 [Dissophora ornata]